MTGKGDKPKGSKGTDREAQMGRDYRISLDGEMDKPKENGMRKMIEKLEENGIWK